MYTAQATRSPGAARLDVRLIIGLFFFSGATSLILETVFSRLLTYTFGNTAAAVSTVLAAFLGGLALGAWALGAWMDGRRPSLRIYGALEAAVALYAALIPKTFALLTILYVHSCRHFALSGASLTAVRFAMAAIAVLPASFLMGGTLPVLSGYVASCHEQFERQIDRLYAWNTLGAASGALISTYGLIPVMGIRGAIYAACGINIIIFVLAAVLPSGASNAIEAPAALRPQAIRANDAVQSLASPKILLLGAFLTGAAALGYEVIWTHVQAFTIGNSVYAFGVTLFAVLCGLGLGAQIAAEKFRKPRSWIAGLIGSQFLLGLSVFLTLPLWGQLPNVFRRGYLGMLHVDAFGVATLGFLVIGYAYWKISTRPSAAEKGGSNAAQSSLVILAGLLAIALALLTKYGEQIVLNAVIGVHATFLFVASELMRFLCAFYLLIIPAILLGIAFPLLINLCSGSVEKAASSVGSVYASNTFGAILGSVLTGFLLIPHLGSQGTLRSLATANIALALFFAVVLVPARQFAKLAWATAGLAFVALGWFGIGNWNPKLICNGAYVYLAPGFGADRVLYQREDTAGGMTSVVQTGSIRTLLSNGKFEGNDSTEEGAQARFALIPMLFVRQPRNGLVIGLGTGQTLKTLSLFPFREIDVAEMAPHIVDAARTWFTDVNGGVIDRDPRVHVSIADGRNFLLLSPQKYDAITIEVTSIWIDGEADLYNHEFYELCSRHLAEGGVLQQWVQLHHMPEKNLLVILNTAARTFPHVAFFVGQSQGMLLASNQPLTIDYNRLRAWDADPELRQTMNRIRVPAAESLLGDLMLYDDSLRQAVRRLPEAGHLPVDFVSSDYRPYLEYETPKGNVYPLSSVENNLSWLEPLRPATLPKNLVVKNVPSADEWNLLMGYVLAERDQTQLALNYLGNVSGPARPRAQEEITRLERSGAPPRAAN